MIFPIKSVEENSPKQTEFENGSALALNASSTTNYTAEAQFF